MLKTPFHIAHGTDKPPFVWASENPYILDLTNKWMSVQREGASVWLDSFDFESECLSGLELDTEDPVFVDIGGGIGHQCQLLKDRYPVMQGRMILQDTLPVIQQALSVPGLEKMPYDFWNPQPVKGKRQNSIVVRK